MRAHTYSSKYRKMHTEHCENGMDCAKERLHSIYYTWPAETVLVFLLSFSVFLCLWLFPPTSLFLSLVLCLSLFVFLSLTLFFLSIFSLLSALRLRPSPNKHFRPARGMTSITSNKYCWWVKMQYTSFREDIGKCADTQQMDVDRWAGPSVCNVYPKIAGQNSVKLIDTFIRCTQSLKLGSIGQHHRRSDHSATKPWPKVETVKVLCEFVGDGGAVYINIT